MKYSCFSGLHVKQTRTLRKLVRPLCKREDVRFTSIASRNRSRARGPSAEVDGHDTSFDQLLSPNCTQQGRGPSSREGGCIRVCLMF